MSDGPWKSLPMRRHWKQVAKQAETGAFSADELSGAMEAAVREDGKELPIEALRRAVGSDDQRVLFIPDLSGQLETLRADQPGSKFVETFFTCLLDAQARGLSGREMMKRAAANAFDEYTRDQSRSVEEHYYRSSRDPKVPVNDRLAAARRLCDFDSLAARMVAPSGSSPSPPSTVKRAGLDEGPLL
ncbi:MAG: hypothetical protein OXF01_08135 [Gemmatimonadetes bacterium]|nr:hypothetical protein [Gemmatimonadota bacterium]